MPVAIVMAGSVPESTQGQSLLPCFLDSPACRSTGKKPTPPMADVEDSWVGRNLADCEQARSQAAVGVWYVVHFVACEVELMVMHWLKCTGIDKTKKPKKVALGLRWDGRSYQVNEGAPNLQRALNKLFGDRRQVLHSYTWK